MMRTPTRTIAGILALSTSLALVACKDSQSIDILSIDASGVVYGTAFLDTNGNGVLDTQDPPLPNVPVILTVARGGQVVKQVDTDSTGFFTMDEIPVGTYLLDLDSKALGDSLEAVGQGTTLTVQPDSATQVTFGASYPVLDVEGVRAAAVGRRVFTSGIALNPRQPFGDGVVHIQGDSLYLRSTNVARANINTGDSIRLLGRVKLDQGEPVLDEVTPYILVSLASIPIPVETGTAEAASADGGSLDAALVRIRNAEISDTGTVNNNFHFTADDGTGKVEVLLRSFLQLGTASIRPDTVIRVSQLAGLLTPVQDATGAVRWQIRPRGGGDILLEVKQADVGIGVTADKAAAASGDQVQLTVVVTNNGPLAASRVQVTDSVPQGTTFVSYDATRGSYSSTTGLWTLDSLAVGAADSLKIRVRSTGLIIFDRATVKLFKEVDPNLSNNAVQISVPVG